MPELIFKGKEFVYNHHLSVPYRPLVAHKKKSVGPADMAGNLIVHGDNLHGLKALLPHYAGRVDCIFKREPVPRSRGFLGGLAISRSAEHLERSFAMIREIAVDRDPAALLYRIQAGVRVPERWGRLAVDLEVA